jgi:hypothetical protein
MVLKKFFRLISYKKSKVRSAKAARVTELLGIKGEAPSGDIVAIAMALHMYYDEVHDTESNVITIKRIERRYSPWSSKIYGVINNR